MGDFGAHFNWINWLTLITVLIGTTVLGHRLRGRTSDMKGFFLGDRNLPWWAVSGSLIATRTSALIFISVPAVIFAAGGNFTYLLAVIGFSLGDIIFGMFFAHKFYEDEIYSPYDYIERQLGSKPAQLTRGLWMVGAILSQSVRLLATALVLSVITGLSLLTCILIIGAFSIAWSIMGGITTVIWTDVIQLCIFLVGAVFAIVWSVQGIPGGFSEVFALGAAQDKLTFVDTSLDPTTLYTIWTALIGATIMELGQLSIDQIFVQRVLCCKNAKEAKKAIYFSPLGNITTPLMLIVGLCLFAFYEFNPLPENMVAELAAEPDRVFPYFLVTEIPDGISGIIIASIFAAGITTLDSALTAVTEASVNGVYRKYIRPEATQEHYMWVSKLSVTIWGVLFALVAYGLYLIQQEGLLALGLSVYGYVYGALFGVAILAFTKRGTWPGIVAGSAVSIAVVIGLRIADIAFLWWYPAGTLVMLSVAFVVSRGSRLMRRGKRPAVEM